MERKTRFRIWCAAALCGALLLCGLWIWGRPAGPPGDLLFWGGLALLSLGLWMLLFRGSAGRWHAGGVIAAGRAGIPVEQDTGVSFDDMAGADAAKAELQEIVEFLQHPDAYGRLGARVPRGILLVGPPGTGKTLLARAVAGEAGVPFVSIDGAELAEMPAGTADVRRLFDRARRIAPAILFIDELDALGRARGLLGALDGFDPGAGIVLLAATSRPEGLDPALLRAGRFDRRVPLGLPDEAERARILRIHAGRVTIDPAADLERIAAITADFTGADLAHLVNEAALLATRRHAEAVGMEDFAGAAARIGAGPAPAAPASS